MNNLKKLLSVLVVVAMIATIALPAFAEGESFTYTAEAQKLNDLGLYKGISTTSFDPDLGTALNRETGIVMLLRIFGLEAEAEAITDADATLAKFTDVASISSWAKNAVAYAVKNGVTQGYPDGTFGPKVALNGKAYATFILRQLGFTPDYNNAPAELADKGGLTADEATKFATKELIKDDLVGMSYGTLSATDKDGKKVIENLVANKVVDETAAVDAGLVTPAATPTPAPVVAALDLSSASSLANKTVEVKLDTAATADDVAAATFKIADSSAKEVAVTSAALAAYDTDNKTVLLTLEAGTSAGTLYTLTVGTKSVNFGGKATETDKPKVSKIEATDYNKVKVTFTEPVKLDGATFVLAEKYGSKAALTVSDMKLSAKDAIELTTGDMKVNTLYGSEISGVADYNGNVMEKVTDKTFVGKGKSTDKQVVSSAKAIEYNKVFVFFKVNVDPAKIATATFKVEEMYGTKKVLEGTAVAATEDDAADAGYTDTTDPTKADAAKRAVVINLTSGEFKANTLYKVTVTGFDTLYGQPMSSTDADTYKTFVGASKPASDSLTYTTPVSTSNTKIEITFANKLDKTAAETVANYALAEAYGTKAALEVKSAELDSDNAKLVKLTVSSMKNVLYKATITGIKDIYGNSIKTSSDANIVTFVGKSVASKIDDIKSAVIDATDNTKLLVTFDQNVGSTATDVSHYTIDNSIGYPEAAETVDGQPAQVKLTIPKTTDGKPYKLTVKGLENSDGIAMDSDGVTENFVGRGNAATLPKVESVIATDERTIKVYFDRDVTESTIKGKLWNDSNNTLVNGVWSWKKSNGNYAAFDTAVNEYVYQDSTDKNVLDIRTSETAFKSGSGYSSFWLKANKLVDTDNDELEFNASNDEATKVVVDAANGINTKTIVLYFNQAVKEDSVKNAVTGAKIVVTKNDTNNTPVALNGKVIKVSDTQFNVITTTAMEAKEYTLKVKDPSNITDVTGKVGFDVDTDAGTGFAQTMTISGSSDTVDEITDITAMMTDKRTVEVYFPVDMLQNANNNDSVLKEGNYILSNDKGSFSPAYVEYDADYAKNEFKATLYLQQDFNNTNPGKYYVTVNTGMADAANLTTVESDDNENKIEIGYDSDDVEAPVLSTATFNDDTTKLTVAFDKPVAFSANPTFDAAKGGANSIPATAFKSEADGDADTFATTDVKANFDVTGTDVNGKALVVTQAVRTSNTEVEFAFKVAPEPSSQVSVKTKTTSIIYDMRKTSVKTTTDDLSEVIAGVPSSVVSGYDTVAPTLVKYEILDADSNGKIDAVKVYFNKSLSGATDETGWAIATTNAAYNAGAAIAVAEATVSDNVVTLDVATSVTKVKTDLSAAFTVTYSTNANNTLQSSGGTAVANGANLIVADGNDLAAPVLATSALAANDTGLTLTFSENVDNAQTDAASLKALIKLATDGTTFSALAAGDTIATVPDGTGATLVINFAAALTTATNKVSIDADALTDAFENTNAAITSAAIDATAN